MNIKTIINSRGEIVEICVIQKEDGSLVDYELKEGEQAVDYLNDRQDITNGVYHPPLKPKWDGTKWSEMASDKELLEIYPVQPPLPPTIEEKLESLNSQIAYIGMMTEVV